MKRGKGIKNVKIAVVGSLLALVPLRITAQITEADLRAFVVSQTEEFRLIFVTSTGRDATSGVPADYDAFADAAADSAGSIVAFIDTTWMAFIDEKDGPRWFDRLGLSLTSSGQYQTATIDDTIFLLDGTAPGLYRYYNGTPYLPDPPNTPINITEQGTILATAVWTGSRNTLGNETGRPGNSGKILHRCFDDDAWLPNTQSHSLYALSGRIDPADYATPPGMALIVK